MNETIKYFAYGSNLDPVQMHARCPGAAPVGIGRLTGWRFRIGHRGVATIERQPASTVWGGLWAVPAEELCHLDRAEGVALGLYQRLTLPIATGNTECDSLVYVEPFTAEGQPRSGYLERIRRGASWFALPEQYQCTLGVTR